MTAPRVVIGHDDDTIRGSAAAAAREAGYDVVEVRDGDAAEAALAAEPTPSALVVDAGLPGKAGFELCQAIERLGLPTKVVLIASVYSKTAYKRKPTSLYGAHDYVEQHHIVDMLGPKLAALVPAPSPLPEGRSAHRPSTLSQAQQAQANAVREAGERRLQPIARSGVGHAEAVARAAQLARLIVTDLLLYSGSEARHWVDEGRRRGADPASRSLPARLANDLDEGRRLLKLSVPVDVMGGRDLIGEAFVELLNQERESR